MNNKAVFSRSNSFPAVERPKQLFTTNYLRKNSVRNPVINNLETRHSLQSTNNIKNTSIHQRLGFQTTLKPSLESNGTSSNTTGVKARLGFNRPVVKLSPTQNGVGPKKKLQVPTVRKDVVKMNILKTLEQNSKSESLVKTTVTKPKAAILINKVIEGSNLVVTPRHNIKAQLNPKLQEEIRKLQYTKDFSTPLTLGFTGRTLNDRFSNL